MPVFHHVWSHVCPEDSGVESLVDVVSHSASVIDLSNDEIQNFIRYVLSLSEY